MGLKEIEACRVQTDLRTTRKLDRGHISLAEYPFRSFSICSLNDQ
jgi:hypothetical protein